MAVELSADNTGNDELIFDAGICEDVSGRDGAERLICPPETTLFHQVLADSWQSSWRALRRLARAGGDRRSTASRVWNRDMGFAMSSRFAARLARAPRRRGLP